MCLCVCPSQEIPRKVLKAIIIKCDTVTASDMIMHHVLIIVTLTSSQGHTDNILNIRVFQKVFKQYPQLLL